MPQYFTLQEALLAAQTASSDYKPKISGGPKAEAGFVQKKDSEFKPIVKGITTVIEQEEPVEPAPIIKEPEIDPRVELERLIRELRDQAAAVPIDENAPQSDDELFRSPPSLIKSSSLVLVDPIRADAQIVHGAQEVQNLYDQQNKESVFVKPFAKKAAEKPKKILPRVATTVAEYVRHPIAKVQNMFRDPYENRDINFAYAVNEMVKKSLFPNNPELALLVPDNFIVSILKGGREKRRSTKTWSAIKDFLPHVTTGFSFDTQQKRALEFLKEQLETDSEGLLKQIEQSSLENSTNLARGFSQTLTKGNELIPNQEVLGNNRILLPGESREIIKVTDATTHQDVIETKIKERIKPIIERNVTLDTEAKKQLVKDITQIYVENVPKEKLDKNGKPKGEAVVDVLALVDELKKPEDRQYYIDHWPELQIISYLGESKGDTLGGQERFLTLNQKIAITCARAGGKITNGWVSSAALAAAKTGVYLGGFAVSYGLGATKFASRSSASNIVTAATWMLGPVWAGAVGGITESYSDINTKLYKHESNVTKALRQVSRDKALREKKGELDYVRSDLELATVETVPASELTKNINQLILTDPNNFGSETKKNITQTELLQLVAHIAHARARINRTMASGTKDLGYKTSNWISYSAGHEQAELTNLKAADVQAYARLLYIQSENPPLFATIPFLAESSGDLNKALNSMTTIIEVGLMEGIPSELLSGAKPLTSFKSQNFYKQIFDASGIPQTETDKVYNFINSLKNTSSIGGKTIQDWMKESESFKLRMKELKQIKRQRFWFAAGTGAATSLAFSGAKHGFEEGIEVINQHFTPIDTGSHEAPTVAVEATDTIIPWENIFSKDNSVKPQDIPMWIEGKLQSVPIKFAHDVQVIFDKDGNIDLKDSDGDILDNFLVEDKVPGHEGGYVFNHAFKYNHQSETVDLNQLLNVDLIHNSTEVDGEPTNFWDKAENYRIVWGHTQKGNTQPIYDEVFKTEGDLSQDHPYGIELKFLEDNVRNSNIVNNGVTSLFDNFKEGKLGALIEIRDLLGDGKDGHILLTDIIERVQDEKGNYYYSLKLDPTSDKLVTLEDGTQMTMGQIAQNILNEEYLKEHPNLVGTDLSIESMSAFKLANNGHKGYILLGFVTDGELKGHQGIGDENQIFMPIHLVSGRDPINPDATIPHQETIDIVQGNISEQPIIIPAIPPIKSEPPPPPTVEHEPIKYTALPGVYNSPQLSPTEPPPPATPSSTPLPASIINQNEFKKEERPARVENREAREFIDRLIARNLRRGHNSPEVDEFIIGHYFTPSQQRFLRNRTNMDFIKIDLADALDNQKPVLFNKLKRDDPQKLSPAEKQDLKQIISQVAKDNGYTEKETLIMSEFIIQQSFYDNLYWAVSELNSINAELERANQQLSSLPHPINPPTPPQPRPRPRPIPTPEPTLEHEMTDEKFIDMFFNLQEAEDREPTKEKKEEISTLFNKFVINKLDSKEQRFFEDEVFVNNFTDYQQILQRDHQELMEKVYGGKPLTTEDKEELKQIIRQINNQPSDYQKIAIFNYFVASNNAIIILEKEARKRFVAEEGQHVEMTGEMVYKNCVYAKIEYENILNKPERIRDEFGRSVNPSEEELMAEKKYRYYGEKLREFDQQFFPSIFGVNLDRLDNIKNVGEFNAKEMFSIIEDMLVQLVFSELETGEKSSYLAKEIPNYLDSLLKNMIDAGLKPKIKDVDDLIKQYKKMLKEKTILVDQDGIKDEDDVIRIEDVKLPEDDILVDRSHQAPELKKSFEKNVELENKLVGLKQKMKEIELRLQDKNDEFAYLSDNEYIKASDETRKVNEQIDQNSNVIAQFEIEKLPIILGGTFDTIVANPNDSSQDAHHYYYNEFRTAFRKFMSEYVAKGKANDFELMEAFNELSTKLQRIDSNVKFVDFADFKRVIISALNS